MKAVALELAERAYTIAPVKPQNMSILAMAHFQNGHFDDAVQFARKAYLTAEPDFKEPFKRQLENYTKSVNAARGG